MESVIPTVPIGIVAGYTIYRVITWIVQWYKSPFAYNSCKPRLPYIIDQPSRAKVLKQHFAIEKVPPNLDAIIVGSGSGGLSTAAILAKAGKKVLVLEQHDQAGGGMHTFIEKGYEFDPGVHYIGEVAEGSLGRMVFDQVTEGQVEWAPLEDTFDRCSIGNGGDIRFYGVIKGSGNEWRNLMKNQFPQEHKAVDKYFDTLDGMGPVVEINGALKWLPLWLCWIIAKTGILHLITTAYRKKFEKSTYDYVCEITKNKDLRTVMTYAWAVLATLPSKMYFPLYTVVLNHYRKEGSFYPVGGPSELTMSLIPIIERAGGKVLVRAKVEEILHNGTRVHGVLVRKGSTSMVYNIQAPLVVSTAGMYNTFKKLLPKSLASKSFFYPWPERIGPSNAIMCAFIGLNASSKELNLPRENVYYHLKNDCGESMETEFCALPRDEAIHKKIPSAFVGCASAKNPNWDKDPDRKNKSTIFVTTGVPYEWFKEFEDTTSLHRGQEYEKIKAALGQALVDIAQEVYPQIKHHIDHVEYATPLTNNDYLGHNFGECYGMAHTAQRYNDPWLTAKLRSATDIPGLYLAGQDSLGHSILQGFCSGIMTASHILERNLFIDILWLHLKRKV